MYFLEVKKALEDIFILYYRGNYQVSLPRLNRGDPWWTLLGSNQRPSDYESDALTV